jgi:cytochrome c oxidase subunit 2
MKPGDYPLALWPPAASASAVETDHLIWAFTLLTLLLVVPIFLGITFFAIRYQDGRAVNRGFREDRDRLHKTPPANATQIEAIGRQWMWKFQHPGGQAEINDLHLPIGEPVVINMISQDVIHSLYIPSLRIQMETLPGRYTQLWFQGDRPGTYRILCSEFCGTDHSVMAGLLTLMTPADYGVWLAHANTNGSLAQEGAKLFASYGCSGCHTGSNANAPSLAGLYGSEVKLAEGGAVTADTTYLRKKILNPDSDKIAGYKQIMPAFKGVIPEDEVIRLIEYIKRGPSTEQAQK